MNITNNLQFVGVSGPVKFDGAERTGIINLNQIWDGSLRVVGQHFPDRANISDHLELNESGIVWMTKSGTRPVDRRDGM